MTPNLILEEIPYNDLKNAYHQLEKKNKDLVDSMYYAAFVQQGLMPQPRHFRKLNQPYFICYHPLQIIGGDFFWIGRKNDWCIYAVGDCTGHGVGGALLSSLAIGFLNYVVYSKPYQNVGEILNEIDKKWIETFNRNEEEEVNNDWLEISIVAYNPKTCHVQFAGANSSIMITDQDHNFIRLKGNPFPIGGWQIEANRKFDTIHKHLKKLEKVFLYSDGFKDQFGGYSDKRFGIKKFCELLAGSSYMTCANQKKHIEQEYAKWKGNIEQTDDICILRIDL